VGLGVTLDGPVCHDSEDTDPWRPCHAGGQPGFTPDLVIVWTVAAPKTVTNSGVELPLTAPAP